MARKKVINELNLNKQQEFERLSAHLKVTGEVKKPVVERAPWDNDTTADIAVEPEEREEQIRAVELPQEIKATALLGDVKLIRQVGNMPSGYQAPITRIDDSGKIYFMNNNAETYFDVSEKGRLFIIFNEK